MRGLFSEFLFNKFRGIWPFLDMVMRGLCFSKKKIMRKSGFLAQKHGDSEGTFLQKKFLKKFRGKWPFSNLVMRGLFKSERNYEYF